MSKFISWYILSIVILYASRVSGQAQFDEPEPLACKEFTSVNTANMRLDSLTGVFGSSCTAYSGSADFSNATFDTLVNFSKSVFNPSSKFIKSVFQGQSNFHDTRFLSPVDFSEAQFLALTDFGKAIFYSQVIAHETKFDTLVIFLGTRFDSLTDFSKARFHSKINFYGASFSSEARFNETRLGVCPYFVKTQFNGIADFQKARFDSVAYFREAEFRNGANFQEVLFAQHADFGFAKFTGSVDLARSTLPDTLYFNNVTEIENEIDFTKAAYSSTPNYIDLTGTSVRKIKLDYAFFKLFFSRENGYTEKEKETLYQDLLYVQRLNGFTAGYEKLDKEFQEFKYLSANKYVENWFHKHWLDYGYHPALFIARNVSILIAALLIILFFSGKLKISKA